MELNTKIKILIVDDDEHIIKQLLSLFKKIDLPNCCFEGISDKNYNEFVNASDEYSLTDYFEDKINSCEPDILLTDVSYRSNGMQALAIGKDFIKKTGHHSKVIYLTRHSFLTNYFSEEAIVWKKSEKDTTFRKYLKNLNKNTDFINYINNNLYNNPLVLTNNEKTIIEGWKKEYSTIFELLLAIRSSIEKIKIGMNYRIFKTPKAIKLAIKNPDFKTHFYDEITYLLENINVYENNYSKIIIDVYKQIIKKYKDDVFDLNHVIAAVIIENSNHSDRDSQNSIATTIENFRKCEPLLYANMYLEEDALTRYRDHFFHTFHVFLLGYIISEWIYNTLGEKSAISIIGLEKETFVISWFFASVFHDIGYIVSKSEKSISQFFEYFFGEKRLDFDNLSSVLEKTRYQNIISYISCYGAKGSQSSSESFLKKKTHIELLLKSAFAYDKDHGVLSAISFLDQYYNQKIKLSSDLIDKYLENLKISVDSNEKKANEKFAEKSIEEQVKFFVENIFKEAIFEDNEHTIENDNKPIEKYAKFHKEVILPAAYSMAIHNELYKKIGTIKLKDNPLSFLLIFCDICQEYDRPKGIGVQNSADIVELIGINYSETENITESFFEVILGISLKGRFRNIFSQAELVFKKYLSSDKIDFKLILFDLSEAKTKKGVKSKNDIEDFFDEDIRKGVLKLKENKKMDSRIKIISTKLKN
jgi:hypothetical protein